MGKSSSSLKKIKHSRDSSKLRSVKKKKKTKRIKPKKIRRIKEYSDENESSGSDSSLYSSSEDDDYRRKKKRRSKVSKKRSQKKYSSSESESDDDDTRLLRKKKRFKRKDEHVRMTKKKKKLSSSKRRKRDSSSSSTSSESNSSRDNRSDDDSESDGKRRSTDRGRRVCKVKASPRISREDELEGDSESDECWQRGDEVKPEENPRRLKSVVFVVSNTYDNDEKVDGHDDVYPTQGGNIDSRNREFGYNVESDEIDGKTTIPYSRTRADDYGCETVGYDDFGENNELETSKSCHIDYSMKVDNLEIILKKRALENLKRFRGVTQRSGIARKEVSSVSEGEPLQIESENVEESQNHGLMGEKLCDPAGSKDLEASEKLIQVRNVKDSGTVLVNFASQQDQQSDGTTKVKECSGISSCTTKGKLVRPVSGKESYLASRKEAACSQDAEEESSNGSTTDKNCRETENGSENIEPVNLSSHADSETLKEFKGVSQSEQRTNDETKDESQYEQKTMTVMRGGEMVQVSYKVYIPKKTSSLERRKLKR